MVLALVLLWSCQPNRPVSEQQFPSAAVTDSTARTPMATAPMPETLPPDVSEDVSEAEQSLLAAGLVDVQSLDSTIGVMLKYSTTDNFVGVDVYGDLTKAYLQPKAAQKLARAQQYLREKRAEYRLLVYDAARSKRVQQILWDTLKKPLALKPLYVANPQVGSIHNYGAAVDLTIADSLGQPLDMGTPFDYFGILAYPSKEDSLRQRGQLTPVQVANRRLLRDVMRRAGFTPIDSEWWHFNALSLARCKQEYGIIK